jgi:hypothetical protein
VARIECSAGGVGVVGACELVREDLEGDIGVRVSEPVETTTTTLTPLAISGDANP